MQKTNMYTVSQESLTVTVVQKIPNNELVTIFITDVDLRLDISSCTVQCKSIFKYDNFLKFSFLRKKKLPDSILLTYYNSFLLCMYICVRKDTSEVIIMFINQIKHSF